ncbi:MAG: rbsA 1 [Verrucomicrobiales bacterium]|nr:rbsA 1 [Verrucomicrobiales bacterium]
MGENGAGKSTLGKILAGVYTADSGQIRLDGREISPANPIVARSLGIAIVHQELAFCPNLTIAENLCLGMLPAECGWLKRGEMRKIARAMLDRIEAHFDVDLPISELSTAQEQMVQIAGAVGTNARIIVMDEPTSSLSLRESERLFDLLRSLKTAAITVLYVSHRLEEIFQLCDRITVLRDGGHVATEAIAGTDQNRVIQQMVGRDVPKHSPEHLLKRPGEEVLRVANLNSPGKFRNINFHLRAGEIVGFAGLIGAGRSEVAHGIMGLDPAVSGSILSHGKLLPLHSVQCALRAGLGYLPEDRKRQGLVLTMNCRENTSLAALKTLSRLGVVQRAKENRMARDFTTRLRVKTPSIESQISGLSGGNQQKVALAKWLACECKVLIVDEPTRGVDVGAKTEIHDLLDELACSGVAIMLISSELPEVMKMARRILVMRTGEITGELARDEFSQTEIMRLMAGLS